MKIQELSEGTRKGILWIVLVAVGIILIVWWGKGALEIFENISLPSVPEELEQSLQQTQEEFTIPSFQEVTSPEETP